MNDDKNFLGRVIALALILGTAYGVRAIAHGRFECSLGGASSCTMGLPPMKGVPPVDTKAAAPVEKPGADDAAGEDEDATLQKKAPVEPPAAPK
jgi:hypothetical protein